jgi:hypothetical protein
MPGRPPAPKPLAKSHDPIDEAKYPNLAAERAFDRAEHIKRAMAAGMTRREAERHADEDMADHED